MPAPHLGGQEFQIVFTDLDSTLCHIFSLTCNRIGSEADVRNYSNPTSSAKVTFSPLANRISTSKLGFRFPDSNSEM